MSFDFGGVLTRAGQILWKYKILWIFGIFASCSRTSGPNFNWNTSRNDFPQNSPFNNPSAAQQWASQYWWVIALIVLVILALIVLAVLLGTIGRIGLIRGTLQAEEGAQSLAFNDLFGGSMPYFWRVFGLTLLIGLLFLVSFLVLAVPFTAFGVLTAGLGFLCFLPLICILAIVAMAVNLVVELANVAIVRENLGIADGWRRGWELARLNPGPVILMAIILGVISFVAGLFIVIPIIAIVVPAAIGTAVGANAGNPNWMPLIIGGICFAAFLPVAIFINGLWNTFVGSAWTLTYLRLAQPPAAPAEPPTLIEANA
ncbi:MAG TPA: hypothetical protein VIU39_00935 [Anaerolineales bacterium]